MNRATVWRIVFSGLFLFWGAAIVIALSGCQRRTDATDTASRPSGGLRDTSPSTRDSTGDTIPITTDRETGCQYIGYDTHGLTPRMSRYVDGKQTQMGCYNTEHQP